LNRDGPKNIDSPKKHRCLEKKEKLRWIDVSIDISSPPMIWFVIENKFSFNDNVRNTGQANYAT